MKVSILVSYGLNSVSVRMEGERVQLLSLGWAETP